ncbi:hypothetical protein PPL_04881 [Heterostelium album PN500]|uniref:Uncharacterized protein n=1 Tax=Heterostelium pallidum (strain ATCC 26659 / Pp 5 / PN500) TaxID=670386 RepID=D3B8T8_HETP5|nr:hypothetical protein PPL_04881 [Heterostelium album PN500]EFA82456.1 hypothetical protein PPL_04881 [Heterostelium album PN500]|eukprot:XP_020434573.1 hypothetical protein PPL_04881 [Heterostelium album PN500]
MSILTKIILMIEIIVSATHIANDKHEDITIIEIDYNSKKNVLNCLFLNSLTNYTIVGHLSLNAKKTIYSVNLTQSPAKVTVINNQNTPYYNNLYARVECHPISISARTLDLDYRNKQYDLNFSENKREERLI